MGIEKKIDSYIERICKRVRNKDVHAQITFEIQDHLLSLKEEAMSRGLSEEEAIDYALTHLGDADVVGEQLDKTHKAPLDVKTILPVMAASLFGLLIMYYLQFHSTIADLNEMSVFNKSLVFYIIGLLIMLALYTFDYRKLLTYSKYVYAGTVLLLLLTVITGDRVDGVPFLNLGIAHVNVTEVTPYLLIISFAGIFHSWNWKSTRSLWFGVGMISIPIALLSTTGALATTFISILVCTAIMHASSAALKQVITFAAVSTIWPIVHLFMHAQHTRISPYAHLPFKDADLIGNTLKTAPSFMSEVHTDFILAYTIYSFGWLAAIAVSGTIVYFIYRAFTLSRSVNNAFGKLLVVGLAATFTAQFTVSILANMGLSALPGVSVPFISFGGSHIIFEMLAVGLLLSIYRRRNTVDLVVAN
ncbi:FtsW/RodA/SpoVE family cell cycle protein [Rossellomorea sp. DA94]|uniref:FtsW/RodA/SpoVE family cell cycle protein n=1 Tax=Rossellomorea sp. DA94 TaxID=3038653 RepID=UPI00244BDDB0|nr:FtsW/RodA/SpoVE family cell cycle protein [Rossellomorea sp. DA94]WGG44782.1 FtsW/RodA/SpoVE family cell cycle protein [Rossellomorea sp. DA94]